ncbi:hypothetical protein [Phaeocystidibacter marisrubri]|uniref:Uncharacterized protein n=1 Tax=Phaeocystidibacter marisrubri TaxID=1577780 RepID=A0A6L3ZBV7_9FLAO|nr:hypothetical protein [Phaeocystidibacter marisrubri]KAB2815112.1 hypothetical protein F8C82_13500 [Phaeocystidibacter marisrubri]GGH70376.1 hypothetical protein GCM10011318_12320 [Phaeocystidibacter marisrubri]
MSAKNPIDEHFKEHLHDVEVQPSADLWSKMEPRLNERPSNRGWLIGIAASLTLAIAVSSYLYDTYQPMSTGNGGITIEPKDIEPIETPVLQPVEEKEVAPEEIHNNTTEVVPVQEIATESPKRRTPSSLNIMPSVVGQDAGESALRETALNTEAKSTGSETRTMADASNELGNRVRFDPNKYLMKSNPRDSEQPQTRTESSDATQAPNKVDLAEYAEEQIDNILSLKPVETPRKDQIRWPEVSINLSPIIQKFAPDQEDKTSTQP